MPIRNEAELAQAVREIDVRIQEVQDYCVANGHRHAEHAPAKIRFPRGFLRTASEQRARLTFVKSDALRTNLAYTLILSDTLLWLSLRTDLWGIPKEMLTKINIFLIGAMCESITKDYLKGKCGKNFAGRTEYLVTCGAISAEAKVEIDWVWDMRNKMHLFQLEEDEYKNNYDVATNRRAIKAFRGLLRSLVAHNAA